MLSVLLFSIFCVCECILYSNYLNNIVMLWCRCAEWICIITSLCVRIASLNLHIIYGVVFFYTVHNGNDTVNRLFPASFHSFVSLYLYMYIPSICLIYFEFKCVRVVCNVK